MQLLIGKLLKPLLLILWVIATKVLRDTILIHLLLTLAFRTPLLPLMEFVRIFIFQKPFSLQGVVWIQRLRLGREARVPAAGELGVLAQSSHSMRLPKMLKPLLRL